MNRLGAGSLARNWLDEVRNAWTGAETIVLGRITVRDSKQLSGCGSEMGGIWSSESSLSAMASMRYVSAGRRSAFSCDVTDW
jgi:hypothetical protein